MKKASRRQAKGLPFYKLQGAGNDVVVFFRKHLPRARRAKAAFLRRMAHRQLGIGTDQFVEVISLRPLAVQIWNADGSTAEMCANGTRSFLFLAAAEKWVNARSAELSLLVSGKGYHANRLGTGYELCLGKPQIGELESIILGEERIPFRAVSTGNPHAVIFHGAKDGEWKEPLDFSYVAYGPRIETHARFPKKTNVEFVRRLEKIGSRTQVHVQAWERGAGATLSCGSGAVAVAAAVRRLQGGDSFVVKMTDYELQVRFEGDQAFLSGPCALVAKGEYYA